MVVVHDEHLVFLLHQSLLACDPVRAARLSKISVGKGSTERKMVCQFECPIGVKHVAVYPPLPGHWHVCLPPHAFTADQCEAAVERRSSLVTHPRAQSL